MNSRKSILLIVAAMFLIAATTASAYEAFVGPTGLLKYSKGKTFDGYTLYGMANSKDIFLIDMNGQVVHKWATEHTTFYAELLPNGNLLQAATLEDRHVFFGGAHGLLREFDWSGKVVWEFKHSSPEAIIHHAFYRMPNGNTLALGWEKKSWDEAVKKGRKPESVYLKDGVPYPPKPEIKIEGIWPDTLLEIDRSGKIVWEWKVWDRLGTGEDQFDLNYQLPLNVGPLYHGPDWTHFNTVQYLADTDQIILNSRNFGEFYIIDHKTGKMVYRWGNPSAYGKGKKPSGYTDDGDQILFGPHHAQRQANGNISVLDNGTFRPTGNFTRVVEMDPKTGKIVWEFKSNGAPRNANSFMSAFQCAAEKQPNGNYLVTSSNSGHIFEVTQDKQIVWDFVNPIGPKGPLCTVEDNPAAISLHRAFRYAPDYPGLKGKDLSPKGYIAGGCPDFRKIFEEAKADAPKAPAVEAPKPAAPAAPAAPAPAKPKQEEEGPGGLKAY